MQTVYILYYKNQVRDIGNQLAFISEHDSFKFIQSQIKPKELYQLMNLCNELLREKREQNQEFERKSEEINETIVSLSHDIRTPLTSLDGYLQLAERSDQLKEKKHYITLAQTRMKQIITLVDQLFLYTKLKNQDYRLELDSIEVVNVLKRRLFFFIEEFSHKNTEPILNLPEFPVRMVGDETALERIYENIIRNYIFHGDGNLIITHEKKQGEFHLHFNNKLKPNQSIHFNKIFSRFYKEDPSRSQLSSGLGLSIVKSLVEKMNGHVYADLKDGQFCIVLIFKTEEKESLYG